MFVWFFRFCLLALLLVGMEGESSPKSLAVSGATDVVPSAGCETSLATTTVLVSFGQRNRPVSFSKQEGVSDISALKEAILVVFKDLLANAEGDLVLQVKREDWFSMFIDLGPDDAVPDKCIIKAYLDDSSCFKTTSTPITCTSPEVSTSLLGSHQEQSTPPEVSHASSSGCQMKLSVSGSRLHLIKPAQGTDDQHLLPSFDHDDVFAAARIFTKHPISRYHQRLNEEAGKLAVAQPSLLTQRSALLKQAREAVHSSGYNYTKGKSRSKQVSESDIEQPKRCKLDKALRQQKISDLNEDIEALKKQIVFKEKRLQLAESVRKYDQCEVINAEIQEVKVKKRSLEHELEAFQKKVKKAKWYQERKKSRISNKSLTTSDESDVPLSSPASFTSRSSRSYSFNRDIRSPTPSHFEFNRSRSLSPEIEDEPAGLVSESECADMASEDVIVLNSSDSPVSPCVPLGSRQTVQQSSSVFQLGLPPPANV